MRTAILVGTLGVCMFAAGQVHGSRTVNARPTVDLPAALAVQPHTYSDGSLSPDYKDAAVLALQVALDRATDEYNALAAHDADVHRGAMVPLRYRCPR